MFERRWASIAPRLFTADGASNGQIQLADTILFKVKQRIVISAGSQPDLELEVKAVLSKTILVVGPKNSNIFSKTDVSAYTVASGSFIYAEEQNRSDIPEVEHFRATFDEEPTNARRSVLVDPYGNYYTQDNPIPVEVDVVLGDVEVNVDLDAFDEDPDSVLMVGSEDGTETGIRHAVRVGEDSILLNRRMNSLIHVEYDTLQVTVKTDNGPSTILAKTGGIAGTTVATMTLTYDADGDFESVAVVQ